MGVANVPDNQLTRAVTMKLAQKSGGSGCKLNAAVPMAKSQ